MGRRARSSVVLLKNKKQRGQKGGSDFNLFKKEDMEWPRLSTIFLERLTEGKIHYNIKCIPSEKDKDEKFSDGLFNCDTKDGVLTLWMDKSMEKPLSFYLKEQEFPILSWNLKKGTLTLLEHLLRSPEFYGDTNWSRSFKIKKLIQWAIESIDKYYTNKEEIVPLKTCIIFDDNKITEEKPMTEFLNDILCYDCSKIGNKDVCDVYFEEECKPKLAKAPSAKVSPMKEIHRSAKTPLASPSGISPIVFTSTPSSNGNASVSLISPMAPQAKPLAIPLAKPSAPPKTARKFNTGTQAKPSATTRTARKTNTGTQAKPSAIPLAKPSATTRTARKQEEPTEAPKIRWWSRLFRKKNTGDIYK